MAGLITIRLETDENVSIKTVNAVGKTIRMLSFLRAAFSVVKNNFKNDEKYYADYNLAKPGVYILINADGKTIYIGQSDNVLDRLNTHFSTAEKTEYWVNTMVFVADGNSPLNISQIKFIEARLIELAKSAAQVQVGDESDILKLKNRQQANLPNISVNDMIVAKNFLNDIIVVTKALGINYFETIEINTNENNKNCATIFIFIGKNYDAKLIKEGDSYILLKGSKVSKTVLPSSKEFYIVRRELLIANGLLRDDGKYFIATNNIPFDSPSTAANIVCGRSANGKIEWKTMEGKTLKDIEE